MRKQLTKATLAALLGVGASQGVCAELYRCYLPDGSISFQQMPCPLAEMVQPRAGAVASPPPAAPPAPVAAPAAVSPGAAVAAPAARAPAAPPSRAAEVAAPAVRAVTAIARSIRGPKNDNEDPKPTKRKREVLELTALLERCRADTPGFAEKSHDLYQAWRRRHAATLSEFDRLLSAKVREVRRAGPTIVAQICTDEWLARLEPMSRMPDQRFSTVEKTWDVFVAALKAADRATALSCLTGTAEARWKERVDKVPDEELRRMGASMRDFKVRWGDDYEKEALAAREDRVGTIGFRNLNEEWKIVDL